MTTSIAPVSYFLVTTICTLTGRRAFMRLAAHSRLDAAYVGSAVGFPVTVVDEIEQPEESDNDRVIRFAMGDSFALERCYAE